MRIRNRIKFMVSVENRFYNRKGAMSALIGFVFALLLFNAAFNIFYCYGMLETERNLAFFRYSVYLFFAYLLLYFLYRVIMRYIGINYALTTGFAAVSFSVSAIAGFIVSRAAYCWALDGLIENPMGFEPVLRRAMYSSARYAAYIALFYVAASLIPAKRQRPALLGRFWFLNVVSPLAVVPALLLIIAFAPEESRVEYARQFSTAYITVMLWLAFRYLLKTVYYFLLLPGARKIKVEEIPKRRLERLANRPRNEDAKKESAAGESETAAAAPIPARSAVPKENRKLPADKKADAARPDKTAVKKKEKEREGLLTLGFEIEQSEDSPPEDKTPPRGSGKPKRADSAAASRSVSEQGQKKSVFGENQETAEPEERRNLAPDKYPQEREPAGQADSAGSSKTTGIAAERTDGVNEGTPRETEPEALSFSVELIEQ